MKLVPVRVASRRPVARRSLLWPIVAAGLMTRGLAVGAMHSLHFERWQRLHPEPATSREQTA